jgi:putative flippase GtrA
MIIRFLAVGVLNTAFGYGFYALLLALGLHYAAAAFFATVVGVIFNFQSSKMLVFRTRAHNRFAQFILSYCLIYLINVIVLTLLVQTGLSAYVAGLATLLPGAAMSYLLQKHWVFKHGSTH